MAGVRAAGDFATPWNTVYLPILWANLLTVFPTQIDYWVNGDQAQAQPLTVIWKDGTEDEDISPGRYSHIIVRNVDLPVDPQLGDIVAKGGEFYDVVRIDNLITGFSTVVIQDRKVNL